MTNPFYTPSGVPPPHSAPVSASMREEFAAIARGFDKFVSPIDQSLLFLPRDGSMAMTGTLLVGTSTALLPAAGRMAVEINGSASALLGLSVAGVPSAYLQHNGAMEFGAIVGPMTFRTGGADRMQIDTAGQVAINAPSAGAALWANGRVLAAGDTAGFRSINSASTSAINLVASAAASDGGSIDSDAGPIKFVANAVERMRIDTSGRVGIGALPEDRLHLKDGNILVESSYPGAGGTPVPQSISFQARQSLGSLVASAGIAGIFTRISDTDYGSNLQFFTAGDNVAVERMRISPAGNLLVGTTDAKFPTSGRVEIDINGPASALLGFSVADTASSYIQYASGAMEFGAITGGMNFRTANATQLAIDAAGRVSVGGSPIAGGTFSVTRIGGAVNSNTFINWTDATSSTGYLSIRSTGAGLGSDGELMFSTAQNGVVNAFNERMRIATTGQVCIGLTVPNGANTLTVGGTIAATGFNNVSDRSLKENIVDADSQGQAIDDIRVRRFNYKAEPDKTVLGFIAQELRDVVPTAVSAPDEGLWGVDYGKLVPLLVKEAQDVRRRLAALGA